MLEVISTTEHKYGDRQRPVGERYMMEEKFLSALQHLGWVELYDAQRHGATDAEKRVAASAELCARSAARAPRTKPTTKRRRT